jgi:hypothetical protein
MLIYHLDLRLPAAGLIDRKSIDGEFHGANESLDMHFSNVRTRWLKTGMYGRTDRRGLPRWVGNRGTIRCPFGLSPTRTTEKKAHKYDENGRKSRKTGLKRCVYSHTIKKP